MFLFRIGYVLSVIQLAATPLYNGVDSSSAIVKELPEKFIIYYPFISKNLNFSYLTKTLYSKIPPLT